MIRTALVALATTAALTLSAPAWAHEQVYAAPLLGSSEAPPNASPGNGAATVTIDFDLFTMRVEASFADLLGATTAAHIHCCTDPGSNVGVATQLPTFVDFPLGVTSGSYDHTFDMSLATSYNPDFITANGGTVATAFNALKMGLDAGRAYMNLHTSAFAGGEVRGLLAPVPEPQTLALMLAGLGGLAWATRRRVS